VVDLEKIRPAELPIHAIQGTTPMQ
jgi:hypothetical protein